MNREVSEKPVCHSWKLETNFEWQTKITHFKQIFWHQSVISKKKMLKKLMSEDFKEISFNNGIPFPLILIKDNKWWVEKECLHFNKHSSLKKISIKIIYLVEDECLLCKEKWNRDVISKILIRLIVIEIKTGRRDHISEDKSIITFYHFL